MRRIHHGLVTVVSAVALVTGCASSGAGAVHVQGTATPAAARHRAPGSRATTAPAGSPRRRAPGSCRRGLTPPATRGGSGKRSATAVREHREADRLRGQLVSGQPGGL